MVDKQRKLITAEVLVPLSVLGVTTTRKMGKESALSMEFPPNTPECPDREIPL
jgi:hypothetical protein